MTLTDRANDALGWALAAAYTVAIIKWARGVHKVMRGPV